MKRDYLSLAIAFFVVFAFGFLVFGFVGFRSLAVFFAFFVLPAFLVLNTFNLSGEEKFFFSLFISLGVFPIVVWLFNRVIPSFRVAAVAVIFSFVLAAVVLWLVRRKK